VSPWLELGVLVVMLVGFAGLVLPGLPGLPVMWLAALVWVLLDGGGALRWASFALITLLTVVGTAAALWWSGRGAARAGAPWWVLLVGLAGMIIGFFAIPVLGVLVGGVAAVWLAELVRLRHPGRAWETTWATIIGYGVGTGVQLAAGVALLLVWLTAVLVS